MSLTAAPPGPDPTGDPAASATAPSGPSTGRPAGPAPAWTPPRRFGRVNWVGLATVVERELRFALKWWPETVLGPIVSSGLYFLIFFLALGDQRDTAVGAATLTFIAPGILMFSIVQQAAEASCYQLAYLKIEGSLDDYLMPPVSPGELTLGLITAAATIAVLTGLPVALIVLPWAGIVPQDLALAVAFGVVGIVMLAAAGLIAGLWARKWDHASAVFSFGLLPLVFLSGVFAPVSDLPEPLPAVMRVNPLFYLIDGFRGATTGDAVVAPWISLSLCVCLTAAVVWLAAHLVRRGWRLIP